MSLWRKVVLRNVKQAQQPPQQQPAQGVPSADQLQKDVVGLWRRSIKDVTDADDKNVDTFMRFARSLAAPRRDPLSALLAAMAEAKQKPMYTRPSPKGPTELRPSAVWAGMATWHGTADPSSRLVYNGAIDDLRSLGFYLNRLDMPWAPDRPSFSAMLKAPPWLRDRYRDWIRRALPGVKVPLYAHSGSRGVAHVRGNKLYLAPYSPWASTRIYYPYLASPPAIILHELSHAIDKQINPTSLESEAVLREMLAQLKFYELAGRKYPEVWKAVRNLPLAPGRGAPTVGQLMALARHAGFDPDSPRYPARGERLLDTLSVGTDARAPLFTEYLLRNPTDVLMSSRLAPFTKRWFLQPVSGPKDRRVKMTPTWVEMFAGGVPTRDLERLSGIFKTLARPDGRLSPEDADDVTRLYNMPLPALRNVASELYLRGRPLHRLLRLEALRRSLNIDFGEPAPQ